MLNLYTPPLRIKTFNGEIPDEFAFIFIIDFDFLPCLSAPSAPCTWLINNDFIVTFRLITWGFIPPPALLIPPFGLLRPRRKRYPIIWQIVTLLTIDKPYISILGANPSIGNSDFYIIRRPRASPASRWTRGFAPWEWRRSPGLCPGLSDPLSCCRSPPGRRRW